MAASASYASLKRFIEFKAMKRFLALALLIALPAWAQPAQPTQQEDAAFLAARDAFARGDRARLARVTDELKTHPLLPWAQYFQLALQLRDARDSNDSGVAEFVERHAGSYLAEKLRADWLKWLVDHEDWNRAREQFAKMQRPDPEASCRGLDARQQLGELDVSVEVRTLLAAPAPLSGACFAPVGRLAASGDLPGDLLWQRLLRQASAGKLKEANAIANALPTAEAASWKAIDTVLDHPAKHLAKLPDNFADSLRGRGLAALAVLRMARADARVAAARWQDIAARYPATESGFVWGRLALAAAMSHQSEAGGWFDTAEKLGARFDEEQHAWRIRAALRAGDWLAVTRAIAVLPDTMASQPEWVYWRGRAVAALGKPEDAHGIYQQIAGQANFYGILAAEALGKTLSLPPRAPTPTAEERQAAETNPLLVRGLALMRADLRLDGLREWNWALTGMNDRQLLAAADFAQRSEVIDRAINTADRTQAEHDFIQRYPTPYIAQVEPRARNVDLDPAWVYGLMRQESRFIMDAKSSAGAKGLMQLMPATAKWVAKKIGMTHYHPGKVTDMDTNVTLGTNYMRMVMDSLDSHPVLASAAYNAGPGRARKWRAENALEGAIYAETIPFNETRDYVKKVMANAMHYAAVMGTTATPTLTSRLGTIRPRGFGDTTAENLP
jgi:soluble lytic murein transglycosylase